MPDDDETLDETGEDESRVIRELRAKAKRTEAAEAEAATLRTEKALLQAGLDLTAKQQTALLAAHEGELTKEALLATAAEIGIAPAPADATAEDDTEQVPADEVAAHQRIAEATGAAVPADAKVVTLDEAIANAKTQQELDAVLNAAGMAGFAQ